MHFSKNSTFTVDIYMPENFITIHVKFYHIIIAIQMFLRGSIIMSTLRVLDRIFEIIREYKFANVFFLRIY